MTTWEPFDHDYDMPVRFEYFALQTRDGWYVLPKLGDTGNRYSSLFVQAERAGGGLLLRYKYDLATAGRFVSTVEEGVIACEVVAGSVACTSKIATHSYSDTDCCTYSRGRGRLLPDPNPLFWIVDIPTTVVPA